jgi:two-component system sensor histidine kinase FlrB
MITGSRKALGGALLNLLENALQACEARSERGAEVVLSAAVVDRQLRISVRDTGEGIAPDAQERIFEPFFTTRSQGTGLGLAIALGVARAHGGSIKLSSRPGDGSEFILSLPAGLADEVAEDD